MTECLSLSRETCTRCKAEPRVKNQRWGHKCFAEANRKHRDKRAREARKFREIVQRLQELEARA